MPGNGLFFSNLQLLFSYDDHNNGSSFLFQDPNGAVKYYTQHPKLHSTKSGSVVWVATRASMYIATQILTQYMYGPEQTTKAMIVLGTIAHNIIIFQRMKFWKCNYAFQLITLLLVFVYTSSTWDWTLKFFSHES